MMSISPKTRKRIRKSLSGNQLNRISERLDRSITHPGPVHLPDSQLDTNQLSLQPNSFGQRSQSLTSLRIELRRAAGGLQRLRPLRRSGPGAFFKALCIAASCVAGGYYGGALDFLTGFRGGHGLDEGGAPSVLAAFDASSSRLETLQLGDDGRVPLVGFLDALDVLSPAYDSMGLMFSVASREMTTNIKKLRRELQSQLDDTSRRHDPAANGGDPQNESSGSWASNTPPQQQQGASPALFPPTSAAATSLQDLVLGAHLVRSSKLLVQAPTVAGSSTGQESKSSQGFHFGWGQQGGGAAEQHTQTNRVNRSQFPLVSKDAFEGALWLGFALHFMEILYGCLGSGGSPAVCALEAYETALKHHQGPAMRAVAKHLMRIMPDSPESLLQRVGFHSEDDATRFKLMMGRWAKAVHRHRKGLEKFFEAWPPHKG